MVKEGALLALVCYALARRRVPARARSAAVGSTFGPLLLLAPWFRLDAQLADDESAVDLWLVFVCDGLRWTASTNSSSTTTTQRP